LVPGQALEPLVDEDARLRESVEHGLLSRQMSTLTVPLPGGPTAGRAVAGRSPT
jgi:hypothetical protein